MKVAIFFSGRVKGFEGVKKHLILFKEKYSADFYVSCGSHNESYSKFIEEFDIDENKRKFEEVKIPKEFFTFRKATETKIENCSSMFYHNKSCIELIEKSGINYDVIVKYRADVNSDSVLELKVEENTIYIPNGNDFGGLNDQIAYGDLCSMKKYCAVWDNIPKICNDGHKFHPETLVSRNIEREKVNIARINFSWDLIPNRK